MAVPHLIGLTTATPEELASSDRVVILGSALGTTTGLWDLALPAIASEYLVVRFDLPGHGQSPIAESDFTLSELADGVIALADSLGITRFDYAGVSVSGAIALELASRYPDRVKHAAVVCSGPYFGGPDAWAERMDQVRSAGTASLVTALPARWFADDFITQDPGSVEKLLNMVASTTDEGYIQVCHALGTYDARGYLSEISVPVLVISGELDPGATPEAGAIIVQNAPGARQIVISHASHQAVVEKPLEVAKDLVEFFSN